MSFLNVINVSKSYKLTKSVNIEVLKNITFSVEQGEWVALLGASGCGKTTLLNIIGTLEKPDTGTITCMGKDFAKMSSRELAKFRNQNIGFVFQAYHLIPELDVISNVTIANKMSPAPDANIEEKAKNLLTGVGLGHRLAHHPNELSGGEQQRVAIARSLINEPTFLLADEPTGNLDRANGLAILELLKSFHARTNTTLIMITHDPEIARHANRIIRIVDGKIEHEQE